MDNTNIFCNLDKYNLDEGEWLEKGFSTTLQILTLIVLFTQIISQEHFLDKKNIFCSLDKYNLDVGKWLEKEFSTTLQISTLIVYLHKWDQAQWSPSSSINSIHNNSFFLFYLCVYLWIKIGLVTHSGNHLSQWITFKRCLIRYFTKNTVLLLKCLPMKKNCFSRSNLWQM